MPYLDPEFEVSTMPDGKRYQAAGLDENVWNVIPWAYRVLSVATLGASSWATTTRIDIVLLHGTMRSYFMKTYTTAKGQAQALGEFESAKALHTIIPENAPRPIAVGVLASDSEKYFLLMELRNFVQQLPTVADFAAVVAKLHRESRSPNGKFGFVIPTSPSLQLENAWCDTWEEFFTWAFRETVQLEQEAQGFSEELAILAEEICSKVIPRLLRPMETNGRSLKPTLLHGNLWHGNVGVDTDTNQPLLYDCCAFYGHNEYDLGMWRAARYLTNKSHIHAYHNIIEISEPIEDHDDRNALYAMRVDLEVSCASSANKQMRQMAMEEMRRLIAKYPDGLEGYES